MGVEGDCVELFEYDALNRRVRTVTDPDDPAEKITAHYYGGGAEVLVEYDVTDPQDEQTLRWFVHGESFPDPLVMVDLTSAGAEAEGTDEFLYYLKDALGSVGALADADGDVVERYLYSPYGQTMVHSSVKLTPIYYHDCDLDGDIDDDDAAHLDVCMLASTDPLCLFVHDQNGNGEVDTDDMLAFELVYIVGEAVPPPSDWLREGVIDFDCNGDRFIDLFDAHGLMTCFGRDDVLCDMIYDFNGDGEVTLADYEVFATIFGGPTSPRGDALQGTKGSTFAGHFGNPYLWTGQRYDPRTGLYHFMYRTYDPETGRWLQKDPIGVLDSTGEAYFGGAGTAPLIASPEVAAASEYLNSFNLYLYVGASPLAGTDPTGRWDEYDDLIADLMGHKIAALGYIQESVAAVGLGLNMALDIAGSIIGIDVFQSIVVLADGRGGFWDCMNVATAAVPFLGTTARISLNASKWGLKFNRLLKGGRRAVSAFDMHHVVPMFLRGHFKGLTVKMNRILHQKGFHPMLQRRLRENGIWYGSHGSWKKYFEQYPEDLNRATDVLLDVSRDCERAYGDLMDGSLTQAIWQQLMAEGRVLSP